MLQGFDHGSHIVAGTDQHSDPPHDLFDSVEVVYQRSVFVRVSCRQCELVDC